MDFSTPVTSGNYVPLVLRSESNDYEQIRARLQEEQTLRLLHAAMGMATETGEFMDVLKKHIFYGKAIDWENLFEESGDLYWYQGLAIAVIYGVLGFTMDDCLRANILKLRARYPERFDSMKALFRNLDAEAEALGS